MKVSHGAMLIAKERTRQVEEEGWTALHDYEQEDGALAAAGACYALDYAGQDRRKMGGKYCKTYADEAHRLWPWDFEYWKATPDDAIKQLTKAGALIAAEIDRLYVFEKLLKAMEKAPKGSFLNP